MLEEAEFVETEEAFMGAFIGREGVEAGGIKCTINQSLSIQNIRSWQKILRVNIIQVVVILTNQITVFSYKSLGLELWFG